MRCETNYRTVIALSLQYTNVIYMEWDGLVASFHSVWIGTDD